MAIRKYHEEYELGQILKTPSITITEAHLVNWAGLTLDFYPLHMDETYAKETVFKERIAHGPLTFAMSVGLMAQREFMNYDPIIAWLGSDIKIMKPVFIGDTIHVEAEIVEKKEDTKVQEEPKHIVHSLDEDSNYGFTPSEPIFQPVKETTVEPVAPTPTKVFNGEESKPSVKHFDNPFQEDNDNDGFEITSRVITHEELETRQAVKVEVVTMEEPKKAIDPKEELKKQRLRAQPKR